MQNPLKAIYQDTDYIFGRKPHGVATSRGQEYSFLDILQNRGSHTEDWSPQLRIFTETQEYGLLNRLDNVTGGLLYFARHQEAKDRYDMLQNNGKIHKIYYAQVYGRPSGVFGRIQDSIYHHRFSSDRMTINSKKGRNKQEASTYWEFVENCSQSLQCPQSYETSLLKIVITRGVRHQIRLHLASLGCPIVGDRLYMTKYQRKTYKTLKPTKKIELLSVGVER